MTPNFFAKGTLLVPSGTTANPSQMHLHVICTNPDATGRQLLVSISTWRDGCDPTCILQRHEHEWLWKDRSFVEYRYTQLRPHGQLVDRVRERVFEPQDDMNGQAFLKVCRGIERSPFTPGPMKEHYRTAAKAVSQVRATPRDAGSKPFGDLPVRTGTPRFPAMETTPRP